MPKTAGGGSKKRPMTKAKPNVASKPIKKKRTKKRGY